MSMVGSERLLVAEPIVQVELAGSGVQVEVGKKVTQFQGHVACSVVRSFVGWMVK